MIRLQLALFTCMTTVIAVCPSRGPYQPNNHTLWPGDYCSYNTIMSSMFYQGDEIELLKTKKPEKIANITRFKRWWSTDTPPDSTDTSRIKTRGLEDILDGRAKRSSSPCCKTTWYAISPYEVTFDGMMCQVYRPPDGWQVIFIGDCGSDASCNQGTCVVEYGYHTWILIIDYRVGYPNIRFVPVSYPKHCLCANIGT